MSDPLKSMISLVEAKQKASFADAAAKAMAEHCDERIATKDAELAALRAQVAELREALTPFVRSAEGYDDCTFGDSYLAFSLSCGDLRRARAALEMRAEG